MFNSAGKSSIVKLVERFYLPAGGQVLLDGHDIGSFDNKWLRRRMAIVSQEPVLYARSIRDNILYGLEVENGVPEDEVRPSCPMSSFHVFSRDTLKLSLRS